MPAVEKPAAPPAAKEPPAAPVAEAASKHAKAAQPIGCETCHGNGADYAKMGVMKDKAQALATGLIMPTKGFCTAKCHKPAEFKDEMLKLAHAHKVK